ncbi:MAG: hypothetical protein PHI07_03835 [Candidatus Omnitrophica bacterium]|nr:hypothetical protein [Candidatus Omnitrophota bacterium]
MYKSNFLFILLILILVIPFLAFAEEITITTYYPSPYGSYRELRSTRVAIGDNYIDGAAYTWEATNGDGGEVDYLADLVVEGNVGIGTANPVAKLDIFDNSATGFGEKLALRRSGAGQVGLSFQQNGVTAFGIVARSGAGSGLAFVDNFYEASAGNERMRILSNGNVGIGTSTPTVPLEINTTGDAIKTHGNIRLGEYGDNIGGTIYFDSYPASRITSSDTSHVNALLIDSGFHMSLRTHNLGSNIGSICFYPGAGNSLVSQMTDTSFYYMGNFGLGKNNPGFRLDVNGTGMITENFMVNGIATIGQPVGDPILPRYGKLLVYGGLEVGAGRIGEGPFPPNPSYYANDNFILFRHRGISEDFIGYRNNAFYFADAIGGSDSSQPDVYAGNFIPYSSKVFKENISALTFKDYRNILEQIKHMDLVYFNYKGSKDNLIKLGVIAEEAPAQIVDGQRKGVSLTDYVSFIAAGLKAAISENEALKKRVEELEALVKK